MRLRRLYLRRFGGFSDAVLDLPQPEGADVTVVLGPNEAGKSTAFAGWLDLLFGIPTQTPAAWRFERKDLEIAAEIELGGTTRTLQRLPTRADNLRDDDGSVMGQGEVDAMLYGLDRNGYRTRFSLDRAMLERGGTEIAKGEGDLGALLFAGMAGLPGVQGALAQTKEAADAFFRIEGRRTKSTALGAGLAELKASEAALKTRLTPEIQARHDRTSAEAEAKEVKAGKELAAARRAESCERDAVLLRERDVDLASLDETLAGLPPCTWSPDEAEAARTALAAVQAADTRHVNARTKLEEAVATAAEHVRDPNEGVAASVLEALEAMVVDDVPVLSRLGPVNDADLVRITERRRALGTRSADARTRFGLQGPAAGLAEWIEPALRAVADARAADDRAGRALERAFAALDARPVVPDDGDTASLREALDTLRDLNVTGLRKDRDDKATALETFGGDPVPDVLPDTGDLRARVARHRSAAEALATAERAEIEASTRLDARRRVLATARDAAAGADAAAVEAARQDRDAAWHRHRASLDAKSADAFSEAMAAHDRLVAGLAEAATRAEAARGAAEDAAEAEAAHAAAVRAVEEARTTLISCDLASIAEELGLRPDAAPDALTPRLDRLREIARTAPIAARAEAALNEALATRDQVHARLRDLLPGVEDPEAAARDRLREAEAAAEARGHRIAAEKSLEVARTARGETQADLAEAEQRRDTALMAEGLDSLALSDLITLRSLAADERSDADDARRERGLRRARDAAKPQIERLTALGDPGDDPVAFARERAEIDRTAIQARAHVEAAREAAEDTLSKAATAAQEAERALSRALVGQGGDGPITERVARLSDAARVTAERSTLSREIETTAGRHAAGDLDAARALPPDPARLGALEDAVVTAEGVHRAAIAAAHDARRARDEAQGGDATARAVQDRATILADLRRGARDAAATLLGHMAGQAALERLVRENRGTMVAAASDAFRGLTGGEWQGLEVFGPDGMTLAARDGERRASVDRLSEGTRAQLFLSLRVAGHAAFCDRNGPLPFITDDILEAFDDTRAEAALRMAGEMGARGQVVFLTHHPHIAALAKRAIPGVSVIDMPRQG